MTLTALSDGLWIDTEPMRVVGMRLTATMAVVRLADGGLLLYSPLSLSLERRDAVEALGAVEHLYAPNVFHHVHVGKWAEAFPSARLHAPGGLAAKRPDLRIDRRHGAPPEPALDGIVEEAAIAGFRLQETALLHRASRTLLVADLVHNVGRPRGAWTQLYTRTMGFHDQIALSRMLRLAAFSDRAAARRSVDAVLALPFDRIVVGHGTPITVNARESLAAAYAWLAAVEA